MSQVEYLGDPNGISAYADRQTDLANAYIVKLGTLTASLTPPSIDAVFPTPPSAPPISVPVPPTAAPIIWQTPNVPVAFTGSVNIDALLPEPFDESPPVLSFPAAPTLPSDLPPSAPGVNLAFDDPVLSLNLPAPPSLLSLNIAAFGGVTLPTFTEAVPELTAVAPSIVAYTPGSAYTSSLLSALSAELLDRIQNGGTGINPDIEIAIWDRARERNARAKADKIRDLERMEATGFTFPPGIYLDARLKLDYDSEVEAVNTSREIAIKQAELELANVTKALELTTGLESKLIDNNNQVEQRIFEAWRYTLQGGIEIYNARVRAYGAYVEAYKTKVNIYEAQIRGELAKVEVYKTQVDAEQAKAQINTALVNQFKTQVDAALANVEVYKAQIAAIQTKAEIEKLKVEIFGEQVRAYTARINTYTAQVEGFKAQVGAEAAKQEAFKSQVDAYTAQVNAATKTADAKIAEFRGRIEAKNAEWEGYKAQVQGEAARAQSIASYNSSLFDGYDAEVKGISAYNETMTKQWQVAIDQAQRVSEIGIAAAKSNAELYMTTRSLALDAAKVGAQVCAQLGAAAVNAINWSTSIRFGQSTNVSNSTSNSTGYQRNDNYFYSNN